jgi:hypothetical protein
MLALAAAVVPAVIAMAAAAVAVAVAALDAAVLVLAAGKHQLMLSSPTKIHGGYRAGRNYRVGTVVGAGRNDLAVVAVDVVVAVVAAAADVDVVVVDMSRIEPADVGAPRWTFRQGATALCLFVVGCCKA